MKKRIARRWPDVWRGGGALVAQNDTHNKRGAFLCPQPSFSGANYIIIAESIRVRVLKKARYFHLKNVCSKMVLHSRHTYHITYALCVTDRLCAKQWVSMREKHVWNKLCLCACKKKSVGQIVLFKFFYKTL